MDSSCLSLANSSSTRQPREKCLSATWRYQLARESKVWNNLKSSSKEQRIAWKVSNVYKTWRIRNSWDQLKTCLAQYNLIRKISLTIVQSSMGIKKRSNVWNNQQTQTSWWAFASRVVKYGRYFRTSWATSLQFHKKMRKIMMTRLPNRSVQLIIKVSSLSSTEVDFNSVCTRFTIEANIPRKIQSISERRSLRTVTKVSLSSLTTEIQ